MGTERRDRVVLAVIVWTVLVSQVLLYPGLADLVDALGAVGISAATWFLVAEFGAFVLFAGVWGAVSDALGRRTQLVAVGAAGGAVVNAVLAVAPTLGLGFGAVLALRALAGALTVGAFSLAVASLADLAGGHGRNMGAAGLAIGLGAALGSVAGGRLTTVTPLAPLYAASALLVVVAVLGVTVEDRSPGGVGGVGVVLAGVGRRPELAVPYAFGFVDRLTAGFFALVGVFYFRETFGLDAAAAGVVLALFFLPFALLQYPLGSLSDRVGRVGPVVGGSVLYGVSVAAVAFVPVVELAAGTMLVVGAFGALVAPATTALVADVVPDGERGTALGGFNAAGSLGFLTGVLAGGLATSAYGYRTAFLVVGGLEVGIALVAGRAVGRLSARGRRENAVEGRAAESERQSTDE